MNYADEAINTAIREADRPSPGQERRKKEITASEGLREGHHQSDCACLV